MEDASSTMCMHIRVSDLEASKRFYRAALEADGNNVEAVYHGPVDRSAPAVVYEW
jgi:catechol 2,3-dioxygenase-like lactoylglutathione lyase family enzyme